MICLGHHLLRCSLLGRDTQQWLAELFLYLDTPRSFTPCEELRHGRVGGVTEQAQGRLQSYPNTHTSSCFPQIKNQDSLSIISNFILNFILPKASSLF